MTLVVGIFGPTASGKSAIGDAVADQIPAELVSADSAQVYRRLPLLTNQSPAHLVAVWEVDHEASVAEYQRLAHATIDDILERGKTPIVVGGTGLYFRAALAELELPPAPAAGARARWEREYDTLGAERAHALLAESDPGAAAAVHPNDRRRVVRALELTELGRTLRPARAQLWSEETRRPTLIVGLDVPQEALNARIESRTREQFASGIVEEARAAWERPLSSTARRIMGLEEIATLPRDQAAELFARKNRQYAAYQRKWMRRIPGLVSVDADRPASEVADEIIALARSRQRVPAGRAR
jgi:tRNA dimethylallyltransferase